MTNQPEPAPAVWIDGDPLMEAIAAAVWEQCRTEHPSSVVDDPRNIAAVAASVARAQQPAGAPATDQAAEPVKQRADCTETEWAEQERARFERLYTRETVRAEEAEARATAMEHAMESTAADALKHRGCHRDLMAQCLRAERAERIQKNADFHLGQEMARRQLAEKETARLRAVGARLRQMTDYWEQQLPEVIRTPAVVSAIRAALATADDPSRMAAESVPAVAGRADNETQPRRGDAFEAWLKAQRDAAADYPEAYQATDGLLDLYRLHADIGRRLSEHVCEGRVVGDCDCLEPAASQPKKPPMDPVHILGIGADEQPAVGAQQPAPRHVGGNAEDCPACHGTLPDYPFICPGPDPTEAQQPKETRP